MVLVLPLLGLAVPAPARAERVEIEEPRGDLISGSVPWSARVGRQGAVARVVFWIDGRPRFVDRRSPWLFRAGMLDASRLGRGLHQLSVAVHYRNKRVAHDSKTIAVSDGDPSLLQAPPIEGASWSSSFESGTFSEWTWWRRRDGCNFSVVDAPSEGVPPLDGDRVARFEGTPTCLRAGRPHSKVFKEWAVASPQTGWVDDAERPLERLSNRSPTGTYRASYYLPAHYRYRDRGWTNVMQFKVTNPRTGQVPQWWVNISPAKHWGGRGNAPMLNVENWGGATYRGSVVPAPRGRWFEIRADLFDGDRIDLYLDGRLWQTVRDSVHPIGTGADSQGWTFGVGHYLGVGRLWVDRVAFTER